VRAVVRRERQQPELRELAETELVRDLAGLLVLLGIIVGGLERG
jgi:hypothetical protein